jgi:hypothetical protein
MRPNKPGTAWREPPWVMASRPGADLDVIGEIVDPPEADQPLSLERLGSVEVGRHRPSGRGSWQPGLGVGQIEDDWTDGVRRYAEPPHRARPVNRFGRLRHRLTAPMWPFVVLALAQAETVLMSRGLTGDLLVTALSLGGRLGYTLCLTLLPVGVLIWRPDAWRSARLVLVGAMVWTTVPALAGIALWIVGRSPWLMIQFGDALSVVVTAAVVASCVGPAIVGMGLERTRRERALGLRMFTQQGLTITAVILPITIAEWLLVPADATLDPLHVVRSVSGAALPIQLLAQSLLAYTCLSCVAFGEPHRRLWQCAAAGATLLAVLTVQEMTSGIMPGILTGIVPGIYGEWGPADSSWSLVSMEALLVAGSGFTLLGLCSPVWSASRDAIQAGRAAPDAVFAWGREAEAETGEPLPMTAIVAVAAGRDHALALDDNGCVGAWGDDTVGQTDVPEGLSDVVAIAAGDGFSLALRADGTVVAWGANDLGQIDVPPDLGAVIAIAAGSDFGLALKRDGTVVGWGDGSSRVIPVPERLVDVTAISAGEYHALALCRDGTVVGWGDNAFGQSKLPPRVRRAVAISAGGDFSLALLDNGTIVAWGDNTYGQLDVPAGLRNVTAISAGVFHAVALRATGDVVGWGGGPQQGEIHPWRLVDFKAVAAGEGFSLALRAA